ncbi:class II fumarate hydratase [Peribacillus deserti]|uniref:Fumarate hydratase class II n=1 Tax=Peribacillus deserti TaxID=673318 RepID=A0A2N5MA91_9BACI|nr:class II fumarate hydratase [Peribacillus deserti]PLT31247.1 class II fumarate hydratase [Peribacillus deserti]
MEFRIEKDTMGEVNVPADKFWGAQTERSRNNFKIGIEKMPMPLIYAYARVKKAAANVNAELGHLSPVKEKAIVDVCDAILAGKYDDQFPLSVWQTGSGTQTNMNVNEVIANRANHLLLQNESNEKVHPNDDVNMSQSSNDSFPTAMHVAAFLSVSEDLLPAIRELSDTLKAKEKQYSNLLKIGRTHLQDATPLTLGQEISGWNAMLQRSGQMIKESSNHLLQLAIGGTAVGSGINAHPDFGRKTAGFLAKDTGYPFQASSNTFHALTSHDELVHVHGAVKGLAADMMKIANDVRWLASGPRCGIGEITIPANEPGSSIMPGKVNPTQSEAVTMAAVQIFGNDAAIGFASSQGNFELNVFKPVIIYNFLQSIRLLADSIRSFNEHCMKGMTANPEKINENLNRSLMLVTALNPHIGYEKAAEIAKYAFSENLTLKEAALQLNYVTEQQFDEWVDPEKMVTKR